MFKTHSHKTNNTHQIKKIIEPIAFFEYEKEFIEKIKEFKSKLCNKYFGETKTHYKLYKSGKNWVVMGISVFVLGGMLVTSRPVSADAVATSISSSTVGAETTNASSSDTKSAAQSAATAASSASDTNNAAQSATTAVSSASDTNGAAQSATTAVSRASDTNSAAQSAATAVSHASDTKSAAQSATTAVSRASDTNSAAQSATTAAIHASDTNGAAQSAATAVSHASDTKNAAQSATTAASRASDAKSAAQSAATAVSHVRNRRSVVQPMADNTLALTNVTKDNLEDYMSLGGSATYDKTTGIVTITPDENDKVGNFALKSKIDMNNSFTLTGQINLGNKTSSQGGADGIGLAFHTGNTTDIGISGANLGIGGLQNAIGFKLDTYHNGHNTPQANEDGAKVASTDSNGYGYDTDPDGRQFPQFGAFVNTSQKQVKAQDGKYYSRWWATTDKNFVQKLNSGDLDGKFHDFVVSYDDSNRKLIIKYTETGGNVLTWSTSIPDEYQAMAMVVSASTGANKNLQQFKISSLDFKQAATVNVKYVDQKGNQLAQGSVSYPSGKVLSGSVTNTGFSVSDPDYPSGMWIDPDKSHYSYEWLQTDRGNQIVLSTNRTGDGVVYVTELSPSNKVLRQYTLNQNTKVPSDEDEFYSTTYYNDTYYATVQSLRDPLAVKYIVSKYDTGYYNTLSYMVPKLITQTTYFVDKDGKQITDSNGNPVVPYTQKGLVGQKYTTSPILINGYYATASSNSNGVMSPFGEIGASYVKDFHDGIVVTYTQTGSDGTMSASIAKDGKVLKTYTNIKPSDPVIKYQVGYWFTTTVAIKNPYIPQTSDVKYVYRKLGNWVVSNPDGSTKSIIYPNDPIDPTEIADSSVPDYPVIAFIPGYTPEDHMGTPLVPVDRDDRTKGYIPPTPSDIGKDTTITYTADQQEGSVSYVDDTTGKTLKTDRISGTTGSKSSYSTSGN
ncbi:lectin-like domain-containing protein, partial [Streptococcus infantarius]|uniref:lectin-like domain-containing protein n=1 Tax=Streptococcus infantarius TaxID=102684 RepID=UPI003D0B2AD3